MHTVVFLQLVNLTCIKLAGMDDSTDSLMNQPSTPMCYDQCFADQPHYPAQSLIDKLYKKPQYLMQQV